MQLLCSCCAAIVQLLCRYQANVSTKRLPYLTIQIVPHNISFTCMDDPCFKCLNVLYGPPPKCSFYSFAFSERIYFDPRQDLGRDRVRDLVRSGSLRQQSKSHMVSFSVFSFVSIFQPFSLSFWSKTGSLNTSHTSDSMNLFQCFRYI